MKPVQISSHSHTGSLSSYSYTTTFLFFEEQGVVAIVTKYENEKEPIIHLTGGTEEDRINVRRFLSSNRQLY